MRGAQWWIPQSEVRLGHDQGGSVAERQVRQTGLDSFGLLLTRQLPKCYDSSPELSSSAPLCHRGLIQGFKDWCQTAFLERNP